MICCDDMAQAYGAASSSDVEKETLSSAAASAHCASVSGPQRQRPLLCRTYSGWTAPLLPPEPGSLLEALAHALQETAQTSATVV